MFTGAPELLIFDRRIIEEKTYWTEKLSRKIDNSCLPLDFERSEPYLKKTDVLEFELSEAICEKLTKLSGQSPFLLYTVLMSSLKVCLFKYSGNETIVVGSPALKASDKPNALTIIDDISEQMSFRQLLLKVRETLLEAYTKQTYPFHYLLKDLKLDKVEGRCMLFDVALRLHDFHHEMPDVNQDITIVMVNQTGKPFGKVEFNDALFTKTTIKSFVNHYANILLLMLENVDALICEAQLLTEAERCQILVDWNDTGKYYSGEKRIHDLIEAQVESAPDRIAVTYEQEQITCSELNARANQLGRSLKELGVGPDALVSICMERSIEMLVGLLGILKAGGAYLPLDPGYPIDRLEMMLADSGARVLLTQEGLLEVMPAGDLKTICLDRDWEEISRESRHNLQIVTSPDHLAYVIYTSGSTGKPKGVMISHRSICNRLEWMNERYPLMEDDSVLQKTSFSFDASVWEFYVPLIAGARVVMARPGGHQDAGYLVKTIAERQITTLQVVPSMLEVIVEERGLAKCKELRRVFCGGEALKTKLKERFFEKIKAELINLYGPTESSIDATSWRCERKGVGNEVERENVPIGKPIANIQMYVLNRSLQAVPVGVAGELHIGGVGLARGYLDRAELTAERFAPNPWGELPGGRMYRTGDIGRYLPDGNIEYLRRADDQVKVRGYRIELGEVEAALKEHALVRNAVVVVREGQNGQKKLTAYIVPGKDHIQSIAWVQNILNDRLPTYMIPSEFVVLEKLPLTKNGKIDRAALPAPDRSRLGSDSDYVAPSTPIEDMLAGIWASVLGLERVGVHDDFFGLGGHSLLVTQVNSRVREIFQVELPLRLHFDCPTIASLAGKIEVAIKKGDDLQVSPIKRVARTGPLPTSFAQERLWFFDQLAPDSVAYNIAVAIRLTGSLNASVLEGSICEIVRRHEALRTIFQDIDGQPYQVITPFESFVLPVVDLSEAPLTRRESEMSRLATENSQRPFSLSEGPLFRVVLLQLCAEEHIALFNMHHIISDGWSVGVFIREIMTIYSALSKCELVQMSELPIQYADFAAWQREYMRGNILESQLEYWRQQLQGDLPVLELPTDRLRPAIQTFRGHTASFSLPPDIVTPLKELSRCENTTLFMTLLAGFNILLSLYSGQEDIIVGTNVANRNRSELEGLIGFFINNLALRTDLSENPTFKEVLRRVRKICVGAYAHQDLPFEKLAQEFQPGRALSLNPLFQTLFVLQNTPQESLELPGLKLAPVAIESRTSPFDLALNMSESGNFLSGFIQYNTDLFKKPTIDRMIKQYEAVLREAVQNPDQRLKSFSLLLEEENLQLLYAFSN